MDDTPRIADLRKKIEKDAASRLFAQLAEELRKEGRFDEAIAVARKGLEKHANYPSARLTLGRALLDSGRAGDAKTELDQVVRASPDNILASKLLGDALDDLGESAQALAQYEKGLKLSPGDRALLDRMEEVKLKLRAASYTPPESPVAAVVPLPEGDAPGGAPDGGPATAPQASEALDRDLASGTFRPGAFNAADFVSMQDEASPAPLPELRPRPPSALDSGFEPRPAVAAGVLHVRLTDQAAVQPVAEVPLGETHSIMAARPATTTGSVEPLPPPEPEMADEADIGGQTLPITSVTLADLYLQQGLRVEANAVLNQVLRSEPQNAEAISRLAAVTEHDSATHSGPASAAESSATLLADHAASTSVAGPGAPSVPSVPPSATPPLRTIPDTQRAAGAVGPADPQKPLPALTAANPKRAAKSLRQAQIASLKAFMDAADREADQQRATPQSPGAFQ